MLAQLTHKHIHARTHIGLYCLTHLQTRLSVYNIHLYIIYVYTYIYIYIYIYIYVYTGLKIGGVVSQNANHFWGNCKSLWHSESQNCESCTFSCFANHFSDGIAMRLFLVLIPFLNKISPFYDTFYVYNAKIRICCEL